MTFHSFAARNFVRALIVRSLAARADNAFVVDSDEVQRLAADRYGKRSEVLPVLRGMLAKSAVAGGSTDASWGDELADYQTAETEFLDAVARISAYGRMMAKRRVPSNVPVIAVAGGATAHWVGQSKAIPMSALDFNRTTLAPLKPSALIVRSLELFDAGTPEAEALITRDLVRAVAELVDSTAFGGAAGVARVTPDALNYGAPHFATTGTFADDVESAVEAFSGQLSTACWIANPRTFMAAGLKSGGKGIACDLGALGGTLGGLPAYASEAITVDSDGAGSLVLIDADAVVECDEGIEFARTTQGMLEFSDAPTGDAITPTASSATLVSLFQNDLIALKATRRLNFILGRSQACVTVTGVAPQLGS